MCIRDRVGVGGVDLRIDHRDRDVGAAHDAVYVGDLQLLEDVLRGVAGGAGVAARRRRRVALLRQLVDVVGLRHPDDLDRGQLLDDIAHGLAVADVEAQHDRAGAAEVLGIEQREPETAHRLLDLRDGGARRDLQHHLVLHEACLVERRNVDDALEHLRQGRRLAALRRRPGRHRRRERRLPHASAAGARDGQHWRSVERGEGDSVDEVVDHLRLRRDDRHLLRRCRRRRRTDRDSAAGLPAEMRIARIGLDAPDGVAEAVRQSADEGRRC